MKRLSFTVILLINLYPYFKLRERDRKKDAFLTTAFGFSSYGMPLNGLDKNFDEYSSPNIAKWIEFCDAHIGANTCLLHTNFESGTFWGINWVRYIEMTDTIQKYVKDCFSDIDPTHTGFSDPYPKYLGGIWKQVHNPFLKDEQGRKIPKSYTHGYEISSLNSVGFENSSIIACLLPFMNLHDYADFDTDTQMVIFTTLWISINHCFSSIKIKNNLILGDKTPWISWFKYCKISNQLQLRDTRA